MSTTRNTLELCRNALLMLSVYIPSSIMGPLFPPEATSKGLSDTVSGLIFSVYSLLMILTFQLAGHLMPKLGVSFLIKAGLWLAGGSQILFGALHYLDGAILFAVYCFAVRSVAAIGAATTLSCLTYRTFKLFPGNLSLAVAINETTFGIGQAIAPPLAAILFEAGGFSLPFYAVGSLILLVLAFMSCQDLTDDPDQVEDTSAGNLNVFSMEFVAVAISLLVTGVSFGFKDPALEPHLRSLSVSSQTVSFIFSAFTVSYTISTLVIGKLADRYLDSKILVIAGSLGCCVSYLCLGPAPYTMITNTIQSNLVAMIMLGAFLALTLVPSFGLLLHALTNIGYADNSATYCLVSTMWLSMYTVGEFLGTSSSGILVDNFGFVVTTQIIALLNFICAILFCFFMISSPSKKAPFLAENTENLASESSQSSSIQ
ncbi:MFS-type transporter SLC18B1 [Halotydeus destructor]|nr:MFS-type transporter SLC18B1 [Halotydeus destructor]